MFTVNLKLRKMMGIEFPGILYTVFGETKNLKSGTVENIPNSTGSK